MRFRVILAVALVGAVSVACDDKSTGGITGPERDATVTMGENYFAPRDVTIPVGGKVLWVYSGVRHNVDFGAQANAPSGCGTFSVGQCLRTFPTAGFFGYDCTLHAGMVGSVTVQ